MKRSVLTGAIALSLICLFAVTALRDNPRVESSFNKPLVQSNIAIAPPEPPTQPCTFPDTNELASLVAGSDLIAIGVVEGSAQVVHYAGRSSTYTRYTLRVTSVMKQSGTTAPRSILIEELGGVPDPILRPGPYLLFLAESSGTDGISRYFIYSGLYGAFPIRAGGVYRQCPNYRSPASPREATGGGQGMAEADFIDEVRTVPPSTTGPTKIGAPKP
jgi:hypothetical protein